MIRPKHSKIDLSAHIAKLREAESRKPAVSKTANDSLLFWGTALDKDYLAQLKGCVGGASTLIRLEPVGTVTQVAMYCKAKGITRVISSSITLLAKLLKWDKRAAPSLANYAGSYFTIAPLDEGSPPIEVVFIAPLKQLATVPYGKFMARRLIRKLTAREDWYKPTEFTGWKLLDAEADQCNYPTWKVHAFLIAIDIETLRENAAIRCISYTGFFYSDSGEIVSTSYVLPLDSDYSLAIMRKWNLLPAPKVFQNGKYDIAYLARYNAPVYNYLYDTAHMFHSWYSELPKDLGFLNSFFLREAVYWKDLAETNDLHEYYRYNALDTWGTGNCWLAMILEAPAYAISNYLLEFPLVFPCHLAEMTGIARDMDSLEGARAKQQVIIDHHTQELNTILDIPEGETFNVMSTPQMKSLLAILGCKDLKSADATNLAKARYRHPFNARIINLVLETRKARKLVSTYLTAGKEFTRQDGTGHRVLYSLNPHGTDTGRLASKEHHFWTGINAQNIPRGPIVKSTMRADPGFLLAEVDLEQAESRDTGYISGDATLIQNVEHSPDFHCANAAAFFGVLFEDMYDVATGKVLNKPLRQLGKPVNHGANYNMGPFVLIDTMGEEKIALAKTLLGLPRYWGYIKVAEYLLEQFHKTYPGIKKVFYEGVKMEIGLTNKLVSKAVHHSWRQRDVIARTNPGLIDQWNESWLSYAANHPAWTRYCFADPLKSKSDLNAYIAHPPQSLNAQTLNKAWLTVFHDIAIHPDHNTNFKLGAQIHDSILFQYREGHEYLVEMVRERMEVPVTIKGYDGIVRTFVVPAGAKKGDHLLAPNTGRAIYWSETE